MGRFLEQNAASRVVVGPMVDVSGNLLTSLAFANTQIVIVKEGSVSAARHDTTSATSVGPGLYRITLDATDTDTLGTIVVYVSASAALQYALQAEVWQSTTFKLFYGSADQIATSAGVSAIVTVVVKNVLTNMDIATSTGVSALVSIVGSNVAGKALTNYQALTSAAASALISVVVKNALTLGDVATSAGMSVLVSTVAKGVLTNADVPTSANMSAMVSAVLNSYNVASVGDITGGGVDYASISGLITNALTNYQVMTSAGTSVLVSVVVKNVLTQMDIPGSASISGAMIRAISQWEIPSSANLSVIIQGALVNYDVPTSGDISAITSAVVQNALTLYDVPTSADISAIVPNAVWNKAATEPGSAPEWTSIARGTGFDWLIARSLNRHAQTANTIEIFTSAGTAIASASVSNNSVSATRDQWRG